MNKVFMLLLLIFSLPASATHLFQLENAGYGNCIRADAAGINATVTGCTNSNAAEFVSAEISGWPNSHGRLKRVSTNLCLETTSGSAVAWGVCSSANPQLWKGGVGYSFSIVNKAKPSDQHMREKTTAPRVYMSTIVGSCASSPDCWILSAP